MDHSLGEKENMKRFRVHHHDHANHHTSLNTQCEDDSNDEDLKAFKKPKFESKQQADHEECSLKSEQEDKNITLETTEATEQEVSDVNKEAKRRLFLSQQILLSKRKKEESLKKTEIKSIFRRKGESAKKQLKKSSSRSLSDVVPLLKTRVRFAPPDKLELVKEFEKDVYDEEILRLYYSNAATFPASARENSFAVSPTVNNDNYEDAPISHQQQNVRCSEDLFNCALHGTLEEMIQYLQKEVSARGSENKKPIDALKKRIDSLNEELKENLKSQNNYYGTKERTQLRNTIEDFKQKHRALKIFKEAEVAIELARGLADFRTFQFTCLRLRDVILTDKGKDAQVDNNIFCRVFFDNQLQKEIIPPIPFHEYMKMSWEYINTLKHFTTSYNSSTDFKYRAERTIRVDIMKGSPKEGGYIKLGSWSRYLDDLDCELEKDESKTESVEVQCSKYLFKATLDVNIQTVERDKAYFRRKRGEYAKRIKDVMKWIESFQSEKSRRVSSKEPLIDVNITYFGGISMLHAAVFVYAIDVIKELRRHGAKRTIKSNDLGTVFDLANSLAAEAKASGDLRRENGFRDILRVLQE